MMRPPTPRPSPVKGGGRECASWLKGMKPDINFPRVGTADVPPFVSAGTFSRKAAEDAKIITGTGIILAILATWRDSPLFSYFTPPVNLLMAPLDASSKIPALAAIKIICKYSPGISSSRSG